MQQDLLDGFNGTKHALFFDVLQECMLAHKLTAFDGIKQFEYLPTKKFPEQGLLDQRYLEAEKCAETLGRDAGQMKV